MDYQLILYLEDLLYDKKSAQIVKIESLKISYTNKFDYTNVLALFKIDEYKIQEVEKKVLEEFNKAFVTHNSPVASSTNIHYFSGDINNMILTFSNTIIKLISQPTTQPIKNNDLILNKILFNNKIDEYLEYQLSIALKNKEIIDKKQNYPTKTNETQIKILNILDRLSKTTNYNIDDFYIMISAASLLKYLAEFYKLNNIEYNLNIENTSLLFIKNNILNFIKPIPTNEQSQEFAKTVSDKNHLDLITNLKYPFQSDSKEKIQNIYKLIEYLCENNQITKTLYEPDKKYAHDYIHDSVCIDEQKITFGKIEICIMNIVNTRMLIKKLDPIKDIHYINLFYQYLNISYKSLSKM
jgi:hypothetical protein